MNFKHDDCFDAVQCYVFIYPFDFVWIWIGLQYHGGPGLVRKWKWKCNVFDDFPAICFSFDMRNDMIS
jgi:hypothetical protein